jgi:two-component system capsular synthesis response regulator RcsB
MIAFTQPIRLAVADDHPLVVLAIERLIANVQNIEIVCRAEDSGGLIDALDKRECDVVIMDFFMPGGIHGDGIELIRYLVKHYPNAAIIVLSMTTDADLIGRAMEAGANAVVSKQDRLELIYVAIVTVLAHEDYPRAVDSRLARRRKHVEPSRPDPPEAHASRTRRHRALCAGWQRY